jgi:DNA-directed RNA polymerase subunit alpha
LIENVLPKVECVANSVDYARFVMEPLERGFATTLGNALRRILLSSLPGAAVRAIKIEGVYHEFATIPHVKEDVIQIILNVKQLRLRCFSEHPVHLSIQAMGEGVITAGDIEVPPDVEIVNPELRLVTLDSPDARLSMELIVERGKGYVPAEQQEGLSIGVIPVDSIFSPVRRVNFIPEHTRIGQVTTYDRLVLDIWTDGTITPEEALSRSAQILVQRFSLLADLGKPPAHAEKQPLSTVAVSPRVYETPIEELDLSVRAYNCLKRSGITKVGQILEMSDDDLLAVRNFGRKSLQELKERLAAKGFMALAEPEGAPQEGEASPAEEVTGDEEAEGEGTGDEDTDDPDAGEAVGAPATPQEVA